MWIYFWGMNKSIFDSTRVSVTYVAIDSVFMKEAFPYFTVPVRMTIMWKACSVLMKGSIFCSFWTSPISRHLAILGVITGDMSVVILPPNR